MLFATTDTIPQPYEILGIVSTAFRISLPARLPVVQVTFFGQAQKELEQQAHNIGGNGVIGVRYAQVGSDVVLVTGTAIHIMQ